MMDKKGANGFQTKAAEGGVPRKQLPYSVETPYGFHLDLDFLKYVDDIEKGNTIKRVHIQRRVKGPPKFSTLPRNFSLPGHGARPASKEKDSTWSGTSTLGPKPKSRVTEVQQIFDFRANEGGTPSQSSRGTTSQGSGWVSAKPREEVGMGARAVEEKTVGSQSRPNLLRASSMPVTLQQRKGSDSSSPDRIVGTPENGSTENMFRPSPDITERRAVPQERTGLHQQITVALKRVRELEEQVKTIPELKAQICSLREEREKLLLQLQLQRQAQAQAQISTSPSTIAPSSDTGSHAQPCAHRPAEGLSLALTTRTTGVTEKSRVLQAESSPAHGQTGECSAQESERLTQPSEKSDKQKETIERPLEHAVQKLSRDMAGQELTSLRVAIKDTGTGSTQDGNAEKAREPEEETDSLQMVQEKLMILEDKLTRASQELENTNSLLKEQIEENKVKEDKIIQLSEGMRVEMCSPEADSRPRRESIDTGTVTEKVDFANQETETESVNKVDKGTDTDKICVEICVPKASVVGIDLVADATVETHDQVTETEAEVSAVSPPRPRANSMERGTVTERIATQDQTTETPVAERVNQVTETEGEAVTDQPQRPRASSADRGTETERVGTVDRVTETEAAQRADRQTETEMARRQDNNPGRGAEAESQVGGGASSERVVGVDALVSERLDDGEAEERLRRDCESAVMKVVTDSLVIVLESAPEQTAASDAVSNNEERTGSPAATGDDKEPTIETSGAQKDSETKESTDPEIVVTEIAETKPITAESGEKKDTAEGEIVRVAVKETAVDDVVVTAAEDAAVKTAAPVRPQRGRKPSAEQAQPPPLQLQAAPVRPRRGSSEIQDKQPRAQAQDAPQPEAQTPTQLTEQVRHEAPSGSLVEDKTQAKKPPGESVEEKPPSQPQGPSPGSGGAQTRPKSILAKAHSQTSATRRGAKELKAQQRGATVSQPPSRGSGEAQPRPTRQGSGDSQSSSQGSRRSSGETPPPHKDAGETPSLRRGSGETAQRRGSTEAQASRRDGGEAQPSGRGSSESPTSPAALGQVVTRLTGLLGEQWAQLGSSSGAQQAAGQQESHGAQKQTAGKRAEAGKGATAKPAGKALPAVAAAATGKPGPSKMSSIQSQLVSSLSVLSAFYSPAQKAAAAASKQQEQGLKSIMKKNGVADKQGNKGAKKNLKFVGVNGGYETTSSEESSGDEKSKVEPEEEDSSEPEVEKEKEKEKEPQAAAAAAAEEKPEEAAEIQGKDAEVAAEGGAAVAGEKEVQRGLLDPESSQELQEEQAEREKVDKAFIDACLYVKDRMEEVSSPDKEMRQVLVVLYQEWFKVSSQKDSQADTVRLYLRQVGLTTPTLLPYVVNLTDGNGNMALHYSVSHSNFPVVKLLLDTGLCETDNVNKAGYTPVMLAALTAAESPDDLEVAQQLLRHGDVNACSRQAGQTALMLAVSHGRVAMVKLLLGSGADANAQDREGSTALMCASEHGHTHIARLLLETGRCDTGLVDKNGQTARSVAEGTSHQEIVDLLKAHAETRASEPSSSSDLL
ncbi:KN motif and ankyrin repeat domain-containing protein 4 [Scophthalmus maximus]|uniref:KN motif and ankyrin repeat domain-containing protein 4 n=1 Tax=Scophthalmus maximus TaxID=52904 RepID=UPI001FA92FC6|nr:KN motif and ankyrin repeat domain-containing protein 4 [Scophthalmus maximus]XP_035504474.2 KN motif and ankyrin repeat domain-containing protein 4 [Scophthalmus maximus]XP_035504475.2 KN motif and ankyrin repeat domain-containing protein 4 [Scophthalmus maximus]XP_035504476.2 KN motif and ankyrin repeat domain-containing protein 4 [Scophthalmus maximus]XP_035504477.2 KN motif and ankyrin repeat domain-containing protein 4 [Scophthalmus maximus]